MVKKIIFFPQKIRIYAAELCYQVSRIVNEEKEAGAGSNSARNFQGRRL